MLRVTCFLLVALAATAFAVPTYLTEGDGRIVNGTDAPPGKYPSQVSYQNSNRHSCGGSILNENWVLTAAHCVDGGNVAVVSILSGTVDLTVGGDRHAAEQLVKHEGYNSFTLINDIALVRVATPFVFDDMTKPVRLPVQDQATAGSMDATVIGWGYPYTGGTVMNQLQEVDYYTVTDEQCRGQHTNTVHDSNICAYYPGGGKGQCSGDSGGPLWVAGQQVGIVSWSIKPCTVAPYPGVFTEVSPYIDWINSHINA